MHFLAESAIEEAEIGYWTVPLLDEFGLLGWQTFHTLRKMGADIPKKFPQEFDRILNDSYDDETCDLIRTYLKKSRY